MPASHKTLSHLLPLSAAGASVHLPRFPRPGETFLPLIFPTHSVFKFSPARGCRGVSFCVFPAGRPSAFLNFVPARKKLRVRRNLLPVSGNSSRVALISFPAGAGKCSRRASEGAEFNSDPSRGEGGCFYFNECARELCYFGANCNFEDFRGCATALQSGSVD